MFNQLIVYLSKQPLGIFKSTKTFKIVTIHNKSAKSSHLKSYFRNINTVLVGLKGPCTESTRADVTDKIPTVNLGKTCRRETGKKGRNPKAKRASYLDQLSRYPRHSFAQRQRKKEGEKTFKTKQAHKLSRCDSYF